jgi:hypothetical protein
MKRSLPLFIVSFLLIITFQTVSAQSVLTAFPTLASAVTTVSGVDDSIIVADARTGNARDGDAGEPAHTCYNNDYSNSQPDNTGSYTMWMAIPVPVGTLSVDTNGSNYDTLVSFYSGAGDFASMTSIGCIDDDIDSQSTISQPVPGGIVYVQISRFGVTTATVALELHLTVSFDPAGLIPDHNAFPNVIALGAPTFLKSTSVDVENADTITEDLLVPSCTSNYSNTVLYSISTEGLGASVSYMFSLRAQQTFHFGQANATFIAIYDDNDNEVACASSPTPTSVAPIIPYLLLSSNTIYTVQIGSSQYFQPIGASRYTLVTQRVSDAGILNNPFFQDPGQWKPSNATGDGVICPTDCLARFVGSTDENSKLTRKTKLPDGLKTAKGDVLRLLFNLRATDPATFDFSAKLKITYSDGKPATTTTLAIPYVPPGNAYTFYLLQASVTSKNINKVQIQFNNKSTDGTIDVQYTILQWESARVAARGEVLPLPAF